MGVFDYFHKISTISPQSLRRFIDEHPPGDYQLIDVRQPREYVKGHLPGAVLIPVGELEERVHELDPAMPTVAY